MQLKTDGRQLWLVAVAAMALMAWNNWPEDNQHAFANQAFPVEPTAGGLVTHVIEAEGRPTQVILIDSRRQVLAVYEIGREKGEIKFVSSRNISFDMQMMGFNTAKPLPEEIKKQLDLQN